MDNEIQKRVDELKIGDQCIARDGAILTVTNVWNPGNGRRVIVTFAPYGCLGASNLDCRGSKTVRVLAQEGA